MNPLRPDRNVEPVWNKTGIDDGTTKNAASQRGVLGQFPNVAERTGLAHRGTGSNPPHPTADLTRLDADESRPVRAGSDSRVEPAWNRGAQ